jgi:hypothetical protein
MVLTTFFFDTSECKTDIIQKIDKLIDFLKIQGNIPSEYQIPNDKMFEGYMSKLFGIKSFDAPLNDDYDDYDDYDDAEEPMTYNLETRQEPVNPYQGGSIEKLNFEGAIKMLSNMKLIVYNIYTLPVDIVKKEEQVSDAEILVYDRLINGFVFFLQHCIEKSLLDTFEYTDYDTGYLLYKTAFDYRKRLLQGTNSNNEESNVKSFLEELLKFIKATDIHINSTLLEQQTNTKKQLKQMTDSFWRLNNIVHYNDVYDNLELLRKKSEFLVKNHQRVDQVINKVLPENSKFLCKDNTQIKVCLDTLPKSILKSSNFSNIFKEGKPSTKVVITYATMIRDNVIKRVDNPTMDDIKIALDLKNVLLSNVFVDIDNIYNTLSLKTYIEVNDEIASIESQINKDNNEDFRNGVECKYDEGLVKLIKYNKQYGPFTKLFKTSEEYSHIIGNIANTKFNGNTVVIEYGKPKYSIDNYYNVTLRSNILGRLDNSLRFSKLIGQETLTENIIEIQKGIFNHEINEKSVITVKLPYKRDSYELIVTQCPSLIWTDGIVFNNNILSDRTLPTECDLLYKILKERIVAIYTPIIDVAYSLLNQAYKGYLSNDDVGNLKTLYVAKCKVLLDNISKNNDINSFSNIVTSKYINYTKQYLYYIFKRFISDLKTKKTSFDIKLKEDDTFKFISTSLDVIETFEYLEVDFDFHTNLDMNIDYSIKSLYDNIYTLLILYRNIEDKIKSIENGILKSKDTNNILEMLTKYDPLYFCKFENDDLAWYNETISEIKSSSPFKEKFTKLLEGENDYCTELQVYDNSFSGSERFVRFKTCLYEKLDRLSHFCLNTGGSTNEYITTLRWIPLIKLKYNIIQHIIDIKLIKKEVKTKSTKSKNFVSFNFYDAQIPSKIKDTAPSTIIDKVSTVLKNAINDNFQSKWLEDGGRICKEIQQNLYTAKAISELNNYMNGNGNSTTNCEITEKDLTFTNYKRHPILCSNSRNVTGIVDELNNVLDTSKSTEYHIIANITRDVDVLSQIRTYDTLNFVKNMMSTEEKK